MPTRKTPPAVSHIHGSAAGAVPGIVSSTLAAAADHKGSMTGMVMQEATKDEILDAFDGELANIHVHCFLGIWAFQQDLTQTSQILSAFLMHWK